MVANKNDAAIAGLAVGGIVALVGGLYLLLGKSGSMAKDTVETVGGYIASGATAVYEWNLDTEDKIQRLKDQVIYDNELKKRDRKAGLNKREKAGVLAQIKVLENTLAREQREKEEAKTKEEEAKMEHLVQGIQGMMDQVENQKIQGFKEVSAVPMNKEVWRENEQELQEHEGLLRYLTSDPLTPAPPTPPSVKEAVAEQALRAEREKEIGAEEDGNSSSNSTDFTDAFDELDD